MQTLRVLSYYSQSNISLKNLEKTAQLINETPGANIKVPKTHHVLRKSMKPCYDFEVHIECIQCKRYIATESQNDKEVTCEKCRKTLNKNNSNYFIFIPFKQQLQSMINEHLENILSVNQKCSNSNVMMDIQSGNIYKNIATKFSNSIILSLVLNTDGANVFKSSTKSLWPIQLYQNYLPASMRYIAENIMVVGLYFGSMKPNVAKFFEPFAKECRSIVENKGINVRNKNQQFNFIPFVTHCCCDLPAKALVQEMIQFNGFNACGFCYHPGTSVQKKSKKKSSTVRYIRQGEEDSKLRTHGDVLKVMLQLSKNDHNKPINGIKSISCMIAFKYFDLVNSFTVDYMHNVLLGVTKQLMKLWFDSSVKLDFHIKDKDFLILNERILSIKPTSDITRKPRSLAERHHFKANEYRSLLLYYLRFCLSGVLPMQYVHHFQLLSAGIYILLRSEIDEKKISAAEKMLIQFADEFETLYGIDSVTMNIHLLRHMPNAVRNLGPLWAQSAFGFEANNGVLVKSANGNIRVAEEIANKYIMKRTLHLHNKNNKNTPELDCCIFTGNANSVELTDAEWSTFIEHGLILEPNVKIDIWQRIKWRGRVYTSSNYLETKSIDYMVLFSNNLIGKIQFYFMHNNTRYALFENFNIISEIDHLMVVKSESSFSIQMAENIREKFLLMQINNKNIVTRVPNYYEKT